MVVQNTRECCPNGNDHDDYSLGGVPTVVATSVDVTTPPSVMSGVIMERWKLDRSDQNQQTKTRPPLPLSSSLSSSSSPPCYPFHQVIAHTAPPLLQLLLSSSISPRPPLSPHLILIVRSLPLQHSNTSALLSFSFYATPPMSPQQCNVAAGVPLLS